MRAPYGFRIAAAVLGLSVVDPASPQEQLRLAVHVEHDAVPELQMALARLEAGRIFAVAGVFVVWRDRRSPAPTLPLIVRVVSGPTAERVVPRADNGFARLGLAMPTARRAYVHYTRVVAVAHQWHVDPGVLLGRVLAHEVVHILLRSESHTATGLMAAEMDPRGTVTPRLDAIEIEGIHNALTQVADARGALRGR
jgi:hypothetical protein